MTRSYGREHPGKSLNLRDDHTDASATEAPTTLREVAMIRRICVTAALLAAGAIIGWAGSAGGTAMPAKAPERALGVPRRQARRPLALLR